MSNTNKLFFSRWYKRIYKLYSNIAALSIGLYKFQFKVLFVNVLCLPNLTKRGGSKNSNSVHKNYFNQMECYIIC